MINMRVALLYGPVHISTLVSWFILRIWDANIGHSGYDFSWAPVQLLPFCTNDEFHDFHHSKNVGNYASHFRFWDMIFGTNKDFTKFKMQQLLPVKNEWQIYDDMNAIQNMDTDECAYLGGSISFINAFWRVDQTERAETWPIDENDRWLSTHRPWYRLSWDHQTQYIDRNRFEVCQIET